MTELKGENLVPAKGSAEREEHLLLLARHIVSHLFSWTMHADGGVKYGFAMRDGRWQATSLSREQILGEVLDWTPVPDFDNGEEWPKEVYEYAWGLLDDVGEFIRTRCTLEPVGAGRGE